MKKMINTEHIEGRIYQHSLVKKTVQNQTSKNYGTEFISGVIEIATDEDCSSIIPVHFTYVVETTSKGNKNQTYSVLDKIINEGKTWILDGKEEATKVKIDTALSVNDFFNQDNKLISSKVNEGGFITIVNELSEEKDRNTFTADILVTSFVRVEADEEKNIKNDYGVVKGYIFNFRNNILPVDFIVRKQEGIEYFESLNVSMNEPVFTKVWGKINCGVEKTDIKEETAFGEESVKTYERKIKEWVITGTSLVPYDFGEENVLTLKDIEKAKQDRELLLADIAKRTEEYKNQSNKEKNNVNIIEQTSIKKETFNF